MIKLKAVFGKIFDNISDKNFFDTAISSAVSSSNHLRCPCCGRMGGFKSASSYQRFMITVSNGSRIEETVDVPRVLCPSCGHTHSLIPDNLIPFGSYSIRFVLTVLYEYLSRTCSIVSLCEKWRISTSTLYAWKKLFIYHHSLLLGILKAALSLSSGILDDIAEYVSFPDIFFSSFGFSFLQLSATYSDTCT